MSRIGLAFRDDQMYEIPTVYVTLVAQRAELFMAYFV